MIFIYNTAKFAPVWTTILKIRAIFVHQTLTEHVLFNSRDSGFRLHWVSLTSACYQMCCDSEISI